MRSTALAAILGACSLVSAQTPNAENPKLGSVAGTVTENKTGAPVKKALVVIQHDQERGIGTTTDAAGKFTLHDLDPGTYILTVEREGYIAAHESERTVLTVKAGETNSNIKLLMLRAGVISGRVVDADGDPLTGASIHITPLHKKKKADQGYFGSTNDRGEYRVFDIPPGDYQLAASYEVRSGPRPPVRMQKSVDADGRVLQDAYPITRYPGTVSVQQGLETPGIDIQMMRTHAVRVRGRIVTSEGGFGFISLQPVASIPGLPSRNTVVQDPNGKFELQDVLPGKYELIAMSQMLNGESKLTGKRVIDVGDTDLDDVQIIVGAGQKVTGRFLLPEGRKLPPGVMVFLGPRSPGDTQGAGFSQVTADGTFSMKDVAPGDYDLLINSTGPSDDLYVSAIRMGSADALADGVHIADGSAGQLEIVLKPNGGTVTCTVRDDKDAAVPVAHVVLAPDTPKRDQLALYGDCKTDSAGTCKITGITPGDYHLFALPGDSQIDYRDPEAFKTFEDHGKAVTFAEGQQQQIDLQFISAVE